MRLLLSVSAFLCLSTLLLAGGCGTTPSNPSSSAPPALATPKHINTNAKSPEVQLTSRKGDVEAFVSYYKSRGFVTLSHQATYQPNGQIKVFRYQARKGSKANGSTVKVEIDASKGLTSTAVSQASRG